MPMFFDPKIYAREFEKHCTRSTNNSKDILINSRGNKIFLVNTSKTQPKLAPPPTPGKSSIVTPVEANLARAAAASAVSAGGAGEKKETTSLKRHLDPDVSTPTAASLSVTSENISKKAKKPRLVKRAPLKDIFKV